MTTPRRQSGLPSTRLIALVATGAAVAAGLFFGYVRLFVSAPPRPLNPRTLDDGLALAMLIAVASIAVYARPDTITGAPPKPRRLKRWAIIPLVVLTLLAAYLRLHELELQSFWYDELTTAANVTGPDLYRAVMPGGRILDSWPGYHIPLFLFARLAGFSEFALRLPSALMGVLLIPAVFVLGRRMYSEWEGLLGAGAVTGINAAIFYTQEARMYGLLILLCALSGYYWLRLAQSFTWRRPPPWMMTLAYAATLILMNYTHYYGLILAFIEGLGALALMGSARRISPAFVAAFAAAGLTYLPWLPMFYQDLHNTTFLAAYQPASLLAMAREFALFVPDDLGLAAILIALLAAGAAFGLAKALRQREKDAPPLLLSPEILLGAWTLLPLMMVYFRSLSATPIILYRYFLMTLPALSVLMGRAITRLPVGRAGQVAAGLGLTAALTANLFASGYYVRLHTTQVREAVRYIVSHDAQYPNSAVAICMLGTIDQIDYYFKQFGSERGVDLKLKPPEAYQSRQMILDANTRYVWLIGEDTFVDPLLLDALAEDFNQIDAQRYHLIWLWLYERKPPPSPPSPSTLGPK